VTKTIFAVDPGIVSGWAVMTVEAEPKPWSIKKIDFSKKGEYNPHHMACAWEAFHYSCYDRCGILKNRPSIVAIEGQYLDAGKKKNVDSLIKLTRKAGRWEEAACAHGLTYEYIQPSAWITAELGKYLRSSQVVVMAKQKCEALYRVSGLSEHEYCAILIGRYVAIREWRKSLQLTIPTEDSR
jgi:hypothetical protein